MNTDVLSQYYKGILGQLNSEVQLINRLFKHNGMKGDGNESAIRDLIEKFIPKKYGIGSGIVIDKNGNQSRQCDIIIYDNYNYPELLSMSTAKFYPVDIVYAVIEVKTALDSEKSKIAIQNIDSVLKLDYIKESFRKFPTDPIGKISNDTVFFQDEPTKPPLGLVFAYETDTNKLDTYLNWFSAENNKEFDNIPSHICALDQGLLVLKGGLKKELPLVFPVVEGDIFQTTEDNPLVEINGKKFHSYKDSLFPYTKVGEEDVLVDQGKTLLNFILILTRMLQLKDINPNLNLMEHYLTEDLKVKFTVSNGKLNVIK
ncbi:DUF6602 domain-containing protein [Algibacter sp. TI.3.09]|uniref:DUF6602 domain-containing protein n=1 Tax=Algibacter sp. TI.3.09 TaxID=3121298 RepID=UPI00311D3CB4